MLPGRDTLDATWFRLGNCSPNGKSEPQTSNRAELRAVIEALRHRVWAYEGCDRLDVATDSSYAVEGCTQWVNRWQRNGWQTSTGRPVKNRDLWEALVTRKNELSREGVEIQFWLIPRVLSQVADRYAREAAALPDIDRYVRIMGFTC